MNDTITTTLGAILALAGAAYAAISDIGLVQDILVGIALGTLSGKLLVRQRERSSGHELPAARVRQIETMWMLVGIIAALVFNALLALT